MMMNINPNPWGFPPYQFPWGGPPNPPNFTSPLEYVKAGLEHFKEMKAYLDNEEKERDKNKKDKEKKKPKTFTFLEMFAILVLFGPLVGPTYDGILKASGQFIGNLLK